MAPQFFVDSRARFFNLVCLLNICVILITSAAAIGAIVLVQFEYKFSLGTFRWFLVAGMIALVIGASVGVVLFSKDNALFSIWHSANINSPLIWGCILFFAATLMLQNYVSNNGTTIHTHNVELYTKLTNIMTIFIIAAVLPLAFAISSFLSHWRAERVSPEYMVFLGMSKGQVESSRQVELAKELYDAAMSG